MLRDTTAQAHVMQPRKERTICAEPASVRIPCQTSADGGAAPLPSELVRLETLVEHRHAISNDLPIEEAHRLFHKLDVPFLALENEGATVGICSRSKIDDLLGERYGYEFFARCPAFKGRIEQPHFYTPDTPIRQVLSNSLARTGKHFHEDVALVDSDRRLLGLIPVEALAQLQSRLVEEQIHRLRELAQSMRQKEKQRLLETLVGGIAHELNNKLTPVQGFADLLPHTEDAAIRAGYAQCISKSVTEASGIIRQLLHLSRPETEKMQPLDMRDIIRDSMIMLKFKLRDRRVEAITSLPPEAALVHGDASQLKQVVMNLVLNAIDATEGIASPHLDVSLRNNGDARVVLHVRDNGSGIPPEIVDRIFDPFFTTKSPDQGSGLGLSVCQSIVRSHQGNLTVETTPGLGSCFSVSLPRISKRHEVIQTPAATAPAFSGSAAAENCGKPNTRVLIVEDDDNVRHLLREMVARHFGSRIDLASNGLNALELTGKHRYDLVISDVRMPLMDGPEFYSRLQNSRPELCNRFVFITGFTGEPKVEERIRSWTVPVLRKPFTYEKIAETCSPLLQKQ